MTASRPAFADAVPAITTFLVLALVTIGFSTICSFNEDAVFFLFLAAPFWALVLVWPGLWLAVAVLTPPDRRWWRTAFLTAALLIAGPVCLACWRAGDYVHLLVMLPTYMRRLKPTDQTRFDWGAFGFATAGVTRTLIYNPIDRFPTEPDADPVTGPNPSIRVEHMIGHFYLVEDFR